MYHHSFSIVIVTWNAIHHLKRFLPSVQATEFPDFEIVIADNASADETAAWVKSTYPEIKVATFEKNFGYCGGNNRGAKSASGDIIVFLNNDVEVTPNWLDAIDKHFAEAPNTAVVQPKIMALADRNKFEYAGAAGGFLDKFGYPFCRGRVFDTTEQDDGQYDDGSPIFWASGAAFAIRKQVFEDMEGFDEEFEFHMEEIDLCWRIQNAGYDIDYTPDSVVYHLGGGSLKTGSPRKTYYNYRNGLFMLWKNLSEKNLQQVVNARISLDRVSMIRSLVGFRFAEANAIRRAHRDFAKSRDQIAKKRDHWQSRRTSPNDPATILPFSVVREYFLGGKKTFAELPVAESVGK